MSLICIYIVSAVPVTQFYPSNYYSGLGNSYGYSNPYYYGYTYPYYYYAGSQTGTQGGTQGGYGINGLGGSGGWNGIVSGRKWFESLQQHESCYMTMKCCKYQYLYYLRIIFESIELFSILVDI